jgi:hypothetical protein
VASPLASTLRSKEAIQPQVFFFKRGHHEIKQRGRDAKQKRYEHETKHGCNKFDNGRCGAASFIEDSSADASHFTLLATAVAPNQYLQISR